MELTAIEDFEKLGKDNALFAELDKICKRKHGIWCEEAEELTRSLERKFEIDIPKVETIYIYLHITDAREESGAGYIFAAA